MVWRRFEIAKNLNTEPTFVYPSEEEIKAAQLACCGRFCQECETPAAYAWRKREVDMAILLEEAIKNELTNAEREIVIEHWFNSLSKVYIAQKRGISSAAVGAAIKRSTEKLERVLKYVFFYQRDICSDSIISLAMGRARIIAAARNSAGENSGERIRNLRQGQCISRAMLARAADIPLKRIEALENGAVLKTDELVAISAFFDVTSDYILKGECDDRK